jgi:mannose-6-phosphate isomerase-like protein (cupin superfamily)
MVPNKPDYLAPDGSEIYLGPNAERGGMALCSLPVGRVTHPVKHKQVEEIWYFLNGHGELWRRIETNEEVVDVGPGIFVTIPPGVEFQFRAKGADPLRFLICTMPIWPGPDEAIPTKGRW